MEDGPKRICSGLALGGFCVHTFERPRCDDLYRLTYVHGYFLEHDRRPELLSMLSIELISAASALIEPAGSRMNPALRPKHLAFSAIPTVLRQGRNDGDSVSKCVIQWLIARYVGVP